MSHELLGVPCEDRAAKYTCVYFCLELYMQCQGSDSYVLIQNNEHIKHINLKGNQIGEEGATKLADCLTADGGGGGGVLTLDLNGNPIGEGGALQFADMLKMNMTLTDLDLGNTEMGTKGVIAIATSLNESNRTLLRLNIENPRLYSVQEETTLHVARMLAMNSTLQVRVPILGVEL